MCMLTEGHCPILQVFRPKTPPEAINLCSRLLEYTPSTRLIPVESCAHCFFDELRDPNTKLPNGRELPPLFNFTPQGTKSFHYQIKADLNPTFT